MKSTTTLALLLAASLVACGGADKPPVTPEPTPVADPTPVPETPTEEPAPAAPVVPEPPPFALTIGEATAYEGTGKAEKAVFKLHADGTTESAATVTKKKKTTVVWNPAATVKADGTIEAKGTAVAKISADAITDLATGQALPVKIDGNTVTADGTDGKPVSMTLADDGKVTVSGGPMDGKNWRIEASDPAVARTVFLLVVTNMMGSKPAAGEMKSGGN